MKKEKKERKKIKKKKKEKNKLFMFLYILYNSRVPKTFLLPYSLAYVYEARVAYVRSVMFSSMRGDRGVDSNTHKQHNDRNHRVKSTEPDQKDIDGCHDTRI